MSLYELLSTSVALVKMDRDRDQVDLGRPVTDDEWQKSNEIMAHLAKFDPSLKLD